MSTINDAVQAPLGRVQRVALIIGVVATLLAAVGAFLEPTEFFRSYLFAYTFYFGMAGGALGLLLIHHLAGGRWSTTLQSFFEAGSSTLPFMALLFLPLILGMHDLYEWTHTEALHDHLLAKKAPYLNVPFFLGRTAFYFVFLLFFNFMVQRLSTKYRENSHDGTILDRLRFVSGPGVALGGLVLTFAAFDWLMSIEPHWYSTIYGAMVTVGGVVAIFALITLFVCWLSDREPLASYLSADLLNDFGSLLLGFTMLWTYGELSQFLLIWSGNLTEEITWYLRRQNGGWEWIAMAILLLNFVVPFVLLISRDIKRNPRTLGAVAALLFIIRLVDMFWMVRPAFSESFTLHWLDIVLPFAIGGLWMALFIRALLARPLVPTYHEKLKGAAHHGQIAHQAH